MKRIAVIVLLVGLAIWPATAQGDRVTRGTVIQATDVVASEQRVLLVHTVRRTDTLLPPYLARLEIRFPPGTNLHSAPFPRCSLARLQARGVGACPRRARVGSATAVGRSVLDSRIASKATIFHGERVGGRRAVLMYVDPEKGPSFVAVGKLAGDARSGVRLDLLFPTAHILIGTWPDAFMTDLMLRFDADFVRAPCRVRVRVTSHFFDEPSLTSSDRARCR